MANSHPGSYCGQDAYSDMLVTDDGLLHRKWASASGHDKDSRSLELYARSTSNYTRGGGELTSQCEEKGGDEMTDVSTSKTVVRRLTPL